MWTVGPSERCVPRDFSLQLFVTQSHSTTSAHNSMTPDAAIAALHAAGDDLEALQEAIGAAAWLDAVPGEDRQKLRGARALALCCCSSRALSSYSLSLAGALVSALAP